MRKEPTPKPTSGRRPPPPPAPPSLGDDIRNVGARLMIAESLLDQLFDSVGQRDFAKQAKAVAGAWFRLKDSLRAR